MNKCKYAQINELVYHWYLHTRELSVPLSCGIVQEKALELAASVGKTDFKASNGWLDSWKSQYGISSFKDDSVSHNIGPDRQKLGKTFLSNMILMDASFWFETINLG